MSEGEQKEQAMGAVKKALLGVGGLVVVLAFIGWEATVAIHDRTSGMHDKGSISTLVDMLARFVDTGKRAKTAYDKGDFETARGLYEKMAGHGNDDAMLRAAVMETQGQGGPVDNVQAVKWFRVLAERGVQEGQYELGLAYHTGSGVEKDYAEALRWYQKAASQGSLSARVNMGVMYLKGHGIPEDRVEAQKWFILAGEAGQKNRGVLEASLTAEETGQARQRAEAWRPAK